MALVKANNCGEWPTSVVASVNLHKPFLHLYKLVQACASEKGQKEQKCKSNLFFCPKLKFPKNQKVENWQNLSKIVSFLHEFNHFFTYLLV